MTEQQIQKAIYSGIFGDEIEDMVGDVKVITYDDVKNFDTIDELLAPYDKVAILYKTSDYYVHWVALWKYDNIIQFFDSY